MCLAIMAPNANGIYVPVGTPTQNSLYLGPPATPQGYNYPAAPPMPMMEICGNGIDDNGMNGADCADPACSYLPMCTMPKQTMMEVCGNGIDDNMNSLIDCADPVCSGTPAPVSTARQNGTVTNCSRQA